MGDKLRHANAGGHAQNAPKAGEHRRLGEELPQDAALLGADGLFQANLPGALGDGYQHDVHHADAAHQQGDAGNPHQLLVGGVGELLQLLGLLEHVLRPVLDGFVLVVLVEQVRHLGAHRGHGLGALAAHGHLLGLVIGEQGGPNGVGDEHLPRGGVAHVGVVVLDGVDDRLKAVGHLHHAHHHQSGGVVLDGLAHGVLPLEQLLGGVVVDDGHRAVLVKVRRDEHPAPVHHVLAGLKVRVVHAQHLAAVNALVAVVQGVVVIHAAGVHRSVLHLGHIQDFLVGVLVHLGDALGHAVAGHLVHPVGVVLIQLHPHHVVPRAD